MALKLGKGGYFTRCMASICRLFGRFSPSEPEGRREGKRLDLGVRASDAPLRL